MTPNNFATVRDVLRYAITSFNKQKVFFGHGTHNAFDEAVYLILSTLDLPLDQLEPFLDARLLQREVDELLRVIEARAEDRIPTAYLTKEAYLQGYKFYVDERVIIPRSYISELIPEQFAPWVMNPDEIYDVLDLCTGSACLPIMMADAFPNAAIDAVDISEDALAVAKINVDEYKLEDRIHLIHSDLYQQLGNKKYDIIISNPPYVNSQSMATLPPEYLKEPRLALAGGEDGMDLVRKIVAEAKRHLTPEGILIVEIGNEREYAEAAFSDLELTWLSTSAGDDMVFLITADQLPD